LLPVAFASATEPAAALVELRVSARTKSGDTSVNATTRLRKGDKIRLELRPRRDSFVYVIHVAPHGTATLLYATRLLPLAAGTRLLLPETGAYDLDAEVGPETISLIASETAIESASPEHARIIRTVERERRWPAEIHFRVTRAQGFQDLYGESRGFSNLPTAIAIRDERGVGVVSVQLNHVK
jgi:hypothetical protein